MKKNTLILWITAALLCSTGCKKSSDSTAVPSANSKDLRVRRFTYEYNGSSNYFTYSYDNQKRLDSIRFSFSNGNTAATGFQYTAAGFTRESITYLTDNDGRITLQSIPYNHEQFKGYYDADGRLSYVIEVSTYNGKEEARRWYTWDGAGNLLKESFATITFNNAGQRLVSDSFVTAYSGFTEANTVGPAAFGFDHSGTAPVAGFQASPDGIRSSAHLPASELQTHYIFATPRVSSADYTSLVDGTPVTYAIIKDSKGRVQQVSHNFQGMPVVESYEYYE